jgi:hypothetical protein
MPVDPWAIDGLNYTGLEARNAELGVMGNGSALGSRSGVRPGDPGLTVSLAGSTINVSAGVAAIAYAGQGVYRCAFPSSVSPGSVTAAHATLARIDLVYLRVWDNAVDASGLNKADIVYLAGTASASPVAPTPAGTQVYMPLATISVPASGGGSPSVSTAVRPYTVAPGGILPSSTAPGSPYTGQYYDDGTNLLRWNGSSWDTYQKVPGAWTSWTPTWATSTGLRLPSYGNAAVDCKYSKIGRTVLFNMSLTWGTTTNFGASPTTSDNWTFSLPVAAAVAFTSIGTAHIEPGNGQRASMAMAQVNASAADISLHMTGPRIDGSATVAGVVDSITPFVWGSTMKLVILGQYESAT